MLRYTIKTFSNGDVKILDNQTGFELSLDKLIAVFDLCSESIDKNHQQIADIVNGRIRCFYNPRCHYYVYEVYSDGTILYFSEMSPKGIKTPFTLPDLLRDRELEEYEAWEIDESLPSDYGKGNGPVMDCGTIID